MSDIAWAGTERVLLVGGAVHAPTRPGATAMLVDGDVITWIGDDATATAHVDAADRVVHLGGRLVTPGFVDAHVHATSTGLGIGGLDLTGADSLAAALDAIAAYSASSSASILIGHGWDETTWPERRPPTLAEVDRATGGRVAYLSRIDVHSALASSGLRALVPDLAGRAGYSADGPLAQDAHHGVREAALGAVPAAQRFDAQRRFRARAAALGIVAVHEMSGPVIAGEDDALDIVRLGRDEPGPLVRLYWGELAALGGVERALALGAVGAAGDLFADGAIGSRTACLRDAYDDAPTRGVAYLTQDDVAHHVAVATRAGIQAGFHVIGDEATATVLAGFAQSAHAVGVDAMRAAGHRLEHAEMLDDGAIEIMRDLGLAASMQPMFDRLWGGPDGMYERRVGSARAAGMNRMADLLAAGVALALGSDAPVTPLGPWQAVAAAMHHTVPTQRIAAAPAFDAHTRAGWRAGGEPRGGTLVAGGPAHYAIWTVDELTDDTLPALDLERPAPECERTVVAGRLVHDSGALE